MVGAIAVAMDTSMTNVAQRECAESGENGKKSAGYKSDIRTWWTLKHYAWPMKIKDEILGREYSTCFSDYQLEFLRDGKLSFITSHLSHIYHLKNC